MGGFPTAVAGGINGTSGLCHVTSRENTILPVSASSNHGHDCHKLLDAETGKIVFSRDVTWHNPEAPLIPPATAVGNPPIGCSRSFKNNTGGYGDHCSNAVPTATFNFMIYLTIYIEKAPRKKSGSQRSQVERHGYSSRRH